MWIARDASKSVATRETSVMRIKYEPAPIQQPKSALARPRRVPPSAC